jgi:hypothetical protein
VTIRNKEAYMNALWDWGFLRDCFEGTKIQVSDVDGIVERFGHLLLIEAKPPGKDVSYGQRIMFREIARAGHTVLVIWGEADKPEEMQVYGHHEISPTDKIKADKDTIKIFVRRWFVWANHLGDKWKLDETDAWPTSLELGKDGEVKKKLY